jgi:putative salt-induced outer membrane protein
MTALPRLAVALLLAASVQPAGAAVPQPALPLVIVPMVVETMESRPLPLPEPVRAMIEAAIESGERKDVETVIALAKATNPRSLTDIDAMLAVWQAQGEGEPEPDPIRQMLAAAMASKKDCDVEAVGALAKKTDPERVADVDALLTEYRAKRAAEKKAAIEAARAKLAASRFWENWKGEGQIGASHSSGNTNSKGLSLGVALNRKGINWSHRLRAQGDYQRTNGRTTVEKFLAEYEPQVSVGDRAFAFGLGRWERDRMAGYDARWNVSGGLGYKVIAKKDLTLNLKAGPAWRQTDLVFGDTESELTGLAALDLGWKLSPTLSLSQVASTIVGERTTTTSSLTALNAKLSGALSARISYSAELDTHPPFGVENLDTLTRFTLVYGF